MTPNILLPQLLPLDSVKLGRFVTRIDQPHENYHDPPSAYQPSSKVSTYADYTSECQTTSRSAFSSTLTSLLSAAFSKRMGAKFRVAADCMKTRVLENSSDWFDNATGLHATRNWIERAIDRRDDIYMIVGFHTLTNAKVNHESMLGNSVGGDIQVPATLSLVAAGIILPFPTPLDPSFGAYREAQDSSMSQFTAPGEQVCALQYRKICYKLLSGKRIDNARLSAVRQWPSTERSMDEEEEEVDIMQVELAEVENPGEGWTLENAGGESVLVYSGKDL